MTVPLQTSDGQTMPVSVWTSTLRRTIQTAEHLPFPKLRWKVSPCQHNLANITLPNTCMQASVLYQHTNGVLHDLELLTLIA